MEMAVVGPRRSAYQHGLDPQLIDGHIFRSTVIEGNSGAPWFGIRACVENQLADPLADARYRFESTTRFTATVTDRSGEPLVFVLSRQGLRWKLSDIRLPLLGTTDAAFGARADQRAGQAVN